ncbi:hypothetical protein GRJ2_000792800 [Grus japonensis]|uniref:Rna-directed dna polymerase from mobile element jockey-like n=1 Tax=Grus japonensis TaxID=30415 RepID=A0ABC9WD91_GRUJA
MEFNLARDVKDNKKGFCKYIGDKRKTMENVGPLLNKTEDLLIQDMEKVEVLNATFTSVFTSKSGLQKSQVPETKGKVWSKDDVPLVEDDQVREYLCKLRIRKSMDPDGMPPKALRKLADVIARPLSMSLIDHVDWEKCPKTGGKQISLLSSRRRTQGTMG